MLQDRFKEFARDTYNVGTVKVNNVNQMCDAHIDEGHSDSNVIAEWRDQINESWADLCELIETRTTVSSPFRSCIIFNGFRNLIYLGIGVTDLMIFRFGE